jgi:protein O-GlcNAc transferase
LGFLRKMIRFVELSESVLLNSNRGLLLERMGRYEEALIAFQAAAHVENNFRDHYNASNMLLFLERYDEAIESFQSSIACRDDYAEAWVNQGIALHALSRHAEARQAFDKALSIDSSFYPAIRSFAILEASIGNDSAAIEYYEKAAAAQPEHVSTWFAKRKNDALAMTSN